VPTTGLTTSTKRKKEEVTVLSLLRQLFDKLNPQKPKSTKLVSSVRKEPVQEKTAVQKAPTAGKVRLTQHQARLTNGARRKRLIKQAMQPPQIQNVRKQKSRLCQQTNRGATMCKVSK